MDSPDPKRLAAPFDDLVQRPDYPLGRQRQINLHAESLAVEVVDDVQQPVTSAVGQGIVHEVDPSNASWVTPKRFCNSDLLRLINSIAVDLTISMLSVRLLLPPLRLAPYTAR